MSVRKNTAYNLAGALIPSVLSLLTLPLYLQAIGEARYGILAIIWVFLGYFGVFDLGMGRATAQRIAALGGSNKEARSLALSSALTLSAAFGLIGSIVVLAGSGFLSAIFLDRGSALHSEITGALPWLMLALPIATLVPSLQGALQGQGRFFELNAISLTGTVLFQLLPLGVALFISSDLRVVLPAALGPRILTMLLLLHQVHRHVLQAGFVRPSRAEILRLLSFGGWATITALISPLMVVLDRLLIGIVAGPQAVTFYTVPFQLAERTTILSISLASSIFPKYAGALPAERDRLTRKALDAVCAVVTPLMIVGVLFIGDFFSLWISPMFAAQAEAVGRILLLGFWANSLAVIPFTRLQALGRADAVARCHLIEFPLYLGLLWLLLSLIGPVGAAIAFATRAIADLALMSTTARVVRLSLAAIWLPAMLMGSVLVFSLLPVLEIGTRLAIACLLTIIALSFSASRGVLISTGLRFRQNVE